MSSHSPISDYPRVSAIIPTRERPALLACAIRSALRQTWPNLEVIVVVDGPDSATTAYLETCSDARLRVVFLDERRGGSDARNAGVRAACGEWVAFLDDDDEWLPEKIAQQMRTAHAMPDWFPVVSCRLIAQSPTTSRVLPTRTYEQPQPIADFLFCRTSLRDPGGVMQSFHAAGPAGVGGRGALQSPVCLCIRTGTGSSGSLRTKASASPWSASRCASGGRRTRAPVWAGPPTGASRCHGSGRFATSSRPAPISWFIAIQCVWRARASHAGVRARFALLRAFFFEGDPEFRSLLSFLIFALVPASLRRSMRKGFWKTRDGAPGLRLVSVRDAALPVLRKSSL